VTLGCGPEPSGFIATESTEEHGKIRINKILLFADEMYKEVVRI